MFLEAGVGEDAGQDVFDRDRPADGAGDRVCEREQVGGAAARLGFLAFQDEPVGDRGELAPRHGRVEDGDRDLLVAGPGQHVAVRGCFGADQHDDGVGCGREVDGVGDAGHSHGEEDVTADRPRVGGIVGDDAAQFCLAHPRVAVEPDSEASQDVD